MSEFYIGEIRLLPYTFAPNGWLDCNGALVQISEYETLFNLIGTTYGGDGQSTFALPNLSGRIPVHQGAAASGRQYVPGQLAGTDTVTLTQAQMPAHTHAMLATSAAASSLDPTAATVLGAISGDTMYTADIDGIDSRPLAPSMLTPAGGAQGHDNTMPSLTLRYCISMYGIYPSQS
ncbi:tail fiber protein [Bacillus subtilis subsp. subtilis]|nr:tail fiber protein [Bacillus subtilis subsp. subtilis]